MSTSGNPAIEVSHLPSATSFYAEIVQPLGISYLSASGSRVNFGWVSQSPDDNSPQPHVVLTLQQSAAFPVPRSSITLLANSAEAVESFHRKSLLANHWQADHTIEHSKEESRARTRDLDGNMLEAVYSARAPGALPRRRTLDIETASTPKEAQRVLQWQQDVAKSIALSESEHSPPPSRASRQVLDEDVVTIRDRDGQRPPIQYRRADTFPKASPQSSERAPHLVSRETIRTERYRRPSHGEGDNRGGGLTGMKLVESPPRYTDGPRRASHGDHPVPGQPSIYREPSHRAVERMPARSYISMDPKAPQYMTQYTIAGPPPTRTHDWARIEERSHASYRTGRSEQKQVIRERSRSESGSRYSRPPTVSLPREKSPNATSQVSHRSHRTQRSEDRGAPHRSKLESDRDSYISARSQRTEKASVRHDGATSTTTIRVVPKDERRSIISAHRIPLPESLVGGSRYADSVAPSDSVSSVGGKRERERLRDRMRERW